MVPWICAVVLMLALTVIDDIKLRARLRQYEHIWSQLEAVGDRNQDGSFTIDVSHLEDHVGSSVHTCDSNVCKDSAAQQAA